jgi:Pyridoxamine 5'-phosphate oxidase
VTTSDVADRRLVPVASCEVLSLLATVRVGRIAFSYRDLPAVQLVSHVIDGGDVVIRSHGQPPVISPVRAGNVVLAYEADVFDTRTFAGWRVTVTGSAGLIRDPDEIAYFQSVLVSWPVGNGIGQFIRLHSAFMSGYRFLGLAGEPPAG